MKAITVLGIGNLLLKDDGVGVHVIKELEKLDYGNIHNIELVDGGTYIFELLDIFTQSKKVIILDSLKGGHAPGTIYKLTAEELGTYIKSNTSLHDVQILDIIGDAKLLGYNPEVIIIGVEPEKISYELDLSPIVKGQINNIIDIISDEIRNT